MKLLSIILCFLITSTGLIAQDILWEKTVIDENLTISLPGTIEEMDTTFRKGNKEMAFRYFKTETENTTFILMITPNETNLNVDNPESLSTALHEMGRGSKKALEEKGFSCSVRDTVVDNLQCKKLICHNIYYKELLKMYGYYFLVNDKGYALQAILPKGENNLSLSELDKVLNNIHFNKSTIKEQQFGSKAESIGYNIGRLIIPLLLIIGVVVYFLKRH